MGYGMDDEDWGEAYAERDMQEDALDNGLIRIGGIELDPYKIALNRLEGVARRFKGLLENDPDNEDVEFWEAKYYLAKEALEYRKKNGEEILTPNTAKTAKKSYEVAKSAKVGETVSCPCCSKAFKKKHPAHTFCSNGRTKKGGNCKDNYWNLTSPKRFARLQSVRYSSG